MGDIMGVAEDMSGLAFTVVFGVGFLFIPLINYVSGKIGKRIGFIVFALIWAVLGGGLMMMVAGPEDAVLYWIVAATGGAVSTCLVY